jgi:hypothetical protein
MNTLADDLRAARGLTDGQIYRWRWAEPGRSYHCKSQIAVVKNGLLIDTYWFGETSDHAIDPADVELTFHADKSWPTISEGSAPYYDPEDVRSMAHANNFRAIVYLRPGATKSLDAIYREIARQAEQANSEIRSATWKLERMAIARQRAIDGEIDKVML